MSALKAAKAVYLNATETDITSLLTLNNGGGVQAMENGSAFDFGFYTQVAGTMPDGSGGTKSVFVNIGLDHNYSSNTTSWTFTSDDVHVRTDYNTVDMMHGTAVGGRW